MLTQEERNQLLKYKAQGKTPDELKSALGAIRLGQQPTFEDKVTPKTTFLQKRMQEIKETGEDISQTYKGVGEQLYSTGEEIVEKIEEPKRNIFQKAVDIGAEVFRGGTRAFGEVVLGAGKTVVPQKVEEKVSEVTGKIASDIGSTEFVQDLASKYNSLDPETKRQIDNSLGYAEGLAEILTGGGASRLSKPVLKGIKETVDEALIATGKGITKTGEKILEYTPKSIKNLKPTEIVEKIRPSEVIGNTQSYLSRKNVGETFEKSVQRLSDDKPLNKYDEFLNQEKKFSKDIKQDTAIGIVGQRIGDAYDKAVNIRREVGKKMANSLKEIKDIRTPITDSFTKFEQDLFNNGVVFKDGKISLSREAKISSQDSQLLKKYVGMLNKLGDNPTIGEIDAFLNRVNSEIDVFKGQSNITKVTNGERLIKQNLNEIRNQLTPEKNPKFGNYFKSRQDYSSLSNFLDEGASFLGKKTQTGDFSKDASLAKSSVQSILNQGKKDWLLALEDLTGYQALDESVLALQAMKDAGNFRGQSLLELLTEGSSIPKSAKDITTKIIEKGIDIAGKKLSGEPEEQTRRVINELLRKK